VLDVFDDSRGERNLRQARAAVLSAARRLPTLHDWACYRRNAVINAVGQQTSSTVTYDHTGGAYERMLTLAAGTWPAWAEFGEVRINNVIYQVESRKSDTVITLDERSNPGADLAAGTSYSLFRSRYPLPLDFRRMDSLYRSDRSSSLDTVTPGYAYAETMQGYGPTGTSVQIAIVSDPKYLGGRSVQLSPAPTSAQPVMFQYWRSMRQLRVLEETTGTVTTSGTALTMLASVLEDKHVGCLIRFSDNGSTAPTSALGNRSDVFNPAYHEATIMSRSSSTAAIIDVAPPTALATVKYSISDPIDLFAGTMWDAFLRLAEWEFSTLVGNKTTSEREMRFWRELEIARDGDRMITDIKDAATAWTEDHGWSLGEVTVT
jgi:hypothetical protein